jgi:hypothetical protein
MAVQKRRAYRPGWKERRTEMNRTKLFPALALSAVVGACAATPQGTLVAYQPGAGQLPATAPVVPPERFPDELLRDPQARLELKARLLRQLVTTTRRVSDPVYQQAVRPRLARQLGAAGFPPDEVADILSDVDYSRRWR